MRAVKLALEKEFPRLPASWFLAPLLFFAGSEDMTGCLSPQTPSLPPTLCLLKVSSVRGASSLISFSVVTHTHLSSLDSSCYWKLHNIETSLARELVWIITSILPRMNGAGVGLSSDLLSQKPLLDGPASFSRLMVSEAECAPRIFQLHGFILLRQNTQHLF